MKIFTKFYLWTRKSKK